ncbi:hypothetical protein ACVWYG_001321 [Pedobacter sp. UYEF25]
MKKINSNLLISMMGLFVVMVGYGVLLSILPFFIERLMNGAVSQQNIALRPGILTAIYLVILVFTAPFWEGIADIDLVGLDNSFGKNLRAETTFKQFYQHRKIKTLIVNHMCQ